MIKKIGMCLAGLSFISSAGFAGTMGDIQKSRGGFVVGGDIGYGYLSTSEPVLLPVTPAFGNLFTTEVQVQRRRIGSLVGGGYAGYDFPVLERLLMGAEVGYKYMGQSKYRTTTQDLLSDVTANKRVKVEQQAVDFLVTAKVFLSQNAHLIGKAGAAYVRSQTKETSFVNIVNNFAGLTANPAFWRIKPEFDLGVGYSFYNNLALNLIYTHVGGADANVTGLFRFYNVGPDSTPAVFQYNALTAGLSYTFG